MVAGVVVAEVGEEVLSTLVYQRPAQEQVQENILGIIQDEGMCVNETHIRGPS